MAKDVKIPQAAPAKRKVDDKPVEFAFGKENYMILIIGIVFIILGFVLMVGGGSDDPNIFNEAIFSTQRLTLAPILILVGLAIELFAIIKKPKD